MDECSVCGCTFDLDQEGGAEGYIGLLPVQFCPTCKAGLAEFFDHGEAEALRDALFRYGKHDDGCRYGEPRPDAECTCGLEAALNGE